MKILVLNGSPKGRKSNTLRLADAFVEGLNDASSNDVDVIDIKKMDVGHCLGCYVCWTKTPGKCVIKDDMTMLLEKYKAADMVVWSFPLYYFSMPSKIKAFMDRLLPLNLPTMYDVDSKSVGHPPRYDLSHQKTVLISTCGFHRVDGNYNGLFEQFDIFLDGKNYTKIICPEGELFRVPQLANRINDYLKDVKKAGVEYGKNGAITEHTQAKLDALLYAPKSFIEMANASWDINDEEKGEEKSDKSENFMRQMAAVYDASTWDGKEKTIEMHFTDIEKTYQLFISDGACRLIDMSEKKYDMRIETPYDVWMDISEGKIGGSTALMQGKYRVLGKFDMMLKMDEYFGMSQPQEPNEDVQKKRPSNKKTNMIFLLLPWIVLWVALPLNMYIAGLSVLGLIALIPLISSKFNLTVYDKISMGLAGIIGIGVVMKMPLLPLIVISYGVFGLMWLISSFTKIPITAYYSNKDYGGEQAYDNPMFMKTNQILSITWGAVYIILAVVVGTFLYQVFGSLTGAVCSGAAGLMGIFTAWFQKWYPAKIARR